MTKEERAYEFGRRLDELMKYYEVNGSTLSIITGINRSDITQARRGKHALSRSKARLIAETLGEPANMFDDLYLPDFLEGEEWRPLVRYPEYWGSNKGRILNPDTGRVLKTNSNKKGTPRVQLHVDSIPRMARVHDLIDETFGVDVLSTREKHPLL